MIGFGGKLLRAGAAVCRAASAGTFRREYSSQLRFVHGGNNVPDANPVALQMINYAFSHARSQKSDESYAQAMLVLEQCLSTQSGEDSDAENSRGLVLLAMSTLFSERGNFDEAMDKLHVIEELQNSSIGVRVAAMEALVGLHLELGQDDTSSVLADKCLELLEKEPVERGNQGVSVIISRAKAVKGLVQLVHGNPEFAEPYFQGSNSKEDRYSTGSAALIDGNVALSYGEYLHSMRDFSLAKEVYQKIIQGTSERENKGFADSYLAACNMALEEVLLGATCALGQLETHLGNFSDAEEVLTKALTKAEEHYGSRHPKVGVILTCIALMFRWKAIKERSTSLLVQEGLFKRAMDILKAPAVESEGMETKVIRRDIVALARGGYAEALCVQQKRKVEGDKLKSWAESVWVNRRLSISEALDWSDSAPKVPIIDYRISRVL